jgi:hypothetical protein
MSCLMFFCVNFCIPFSVRSGATTETEMCRATAACLRPVNCVLSQLQWNMECPTACGQPQKMRTGTRMILTQPSNGGTPWYADLVFFFFCTCPYFNFKFDLFVMIIFFLVDLSTFCAQWRHNRDGDVPRHSGVPGGPYWPEMFQRVPRGALRRRMRQYPPTTVQPIQPGVWQRQGRVRQH